MNNLLKTNIENQFNELETASLKNQKTRDNGLSQEDVLQRLYGAVGSTSGEKDVDNETLKNLDGSRFTVTAEIGAFRWGYGYWDRKEEQVLLKNIKMQNSGKLFKNQWFACGKWTQGLKVGDTIVFDAILKNGKLQYPRNVNLIKTGSGNFGPPAPPGSGIQMKMPF